MPQDVVTRKIFDFDVACGLRPVSIQLVVCVGFLLCQYTWRWALFDEGTHFKVA